MDFVINSQYILVVQGNDRKLTYTCTITSLDETSISFRDKFGKEFSYRKDQILSSEKVEQ